MVSSTDVEWRGGVWRSRMAMAIVLTVIFASSVGEAALLAHYDFANSAFPSVDGNPETDAANATLHGGVWAKAAADNIWTDTNKLPMEDAGPIDAAAYVQFSISPTNLPIIAYNEISLTIQGERSHPNVDDFHVSVYFSEDGFVENYVFAGTATVRAPATTTATIDLWGSYRQSRR